MHGEILIAYGINLRLEIKELLGVYETVRDDMWKGFVFPVGEKPNDKSWTGFQCYNHKTGSGYLTFFREFNNTESEKDIKCNTRIIGEAEKRTVVK